MKPVRPVSARKASKAKHGAPGGGEAEAEKMIPAAKVIKEFGVSASGKPVPAPAPWAEKAKSSPAIGVPSLVEEAHARGVKEGRAAAQAEAEARLEEQKRFYEQQLELERCTRVAREAEQFTQQLDTGLNALKTDIAGQTARILKPFLIEQVQRHAIDELCAALDAVLANDQGLKVEVSGPEDLLQLLREKLSERPVATEFTPAEGTDVRISAGQTILETRLAAWMAKLEEITK
jgi:hypothetical protein